MRFLPDGTVVEVSHGARLLAVVLAADRPIGHSCRGQGLCVACRVRVVGACSAVGPQERALLDSLEEPAGQRLACLTRVEGDLTVQADYW